MGADRWSPCPRCARLRAKGVVNREAELKAAYGKVPVDEFDRMRAALEAYRNAPVKDTLREDFYVGVDGDKFEVAYTGSCSECGFTHEFRHDETFAP